MRDSIYDDWEKRVFIKEVRGKALCWGVVETIKEAKEQTVTYLWNEMKEIEEPGDFDYSVTFTKQEIADLLKIDVEFFKNSGIMVNKIKKQRPIHSAIVRYWTVRGHFNTELYNRIVRIKNA